MFTIFCARLWLEYKIKFALLETANTTVKSVICILYYKGVKLLLFTCQRGQVIEKCGLWDIHIIPPFLRQL